MKQAKKYRGVYEREPGSESWWIRYADAAGVIHREKVGSRGAAIDLYRKRKTEIMEGKKLPERLRAKAVSVSVLLDDALEYSRAHKVSYEHDEWRAEKLREAFGSRSAESLTPQQIERWFADHKNWKPATANRYRALLSLIYRLGIQNGKVISNPARLVRHRRENNARLRWLSDEEEKTLRTIVETKYAAHLSELELALHTGLRRSEQYRLSWDCVDFERRLLTVPQSKNGETRHVPLNTDALHALGTVLSGCKGIGRVFVNEKGEAVNTPRQWFEPAVKDAGLAGFTWHCLRHTFASRLVMKGVDLRTVQELMGHKTIGMTCRYAHLAASHKMAAVERLSASAALQNGSTDTRTDTGTSEAQRAQAAATH
jgi:site-specific recombinase XerD